MSLAKLKKLIRPPDRPSEIGSLEHWRAVEGQLGTSLPRDYREFISTYGTGVFAHFYCVYSPFSKNKHLSLLRCAELVCRYNRQSREEFPERFPYPYFPEPDGLLPWGVDENGNDYFWLTQGAPSNWIVVEDENRGNGIQVHS